LDQYLNVLYIRTLALFSITNLSFNQMKRADIFKSSDSSYISYLLLNDDPNGRFNIYNSNTGKYISYGNLRNNQIQIYDADTNKYIAYGNLNGKRFDLYDSESNEYISYGMFS
jgi:hypothetical protein